MRHYTCEQHLNGTNILKVVENFRKRTFILAAVPLHWWKYQCSHALLHKCWQLTVLETTEGIWISIGCLSQCWLQIWFAACLSTYIPWLLTVEQRRYKWDIHTDLSQRAEVDKNIMKLIFVVPCIMLYSGEISPTRCNIAFFLFEMTFLYMFRVTVSPIIRSTMLYMATGELAHLGCY